MNVHTRHIPATKVEPGDVATHRSGTLDSRPVAEVSGTLIRLRIGGVTTGWLPRRNYTFQRPLDATESDAR